MHSSISDKERIQSLDVIRGIAIAGIFLVNVPNILRIEPLSGRAYEGFDAVVRLLLDLFVQTKFYVIFAFLFGVGFYIFMSRAEASGKRMYPLFVRRLLLLLLMGVLHYVLLWDGDILHMYAISGFWLLLFYRRKPKALLIGAVICIALFLGLAYISFQGSDASAMSGFYYNGLDDYMMRTTERLNLFLNVALPNVVAYTPEILGLFLLGLYCAKIDLFRRVESFVRPLRVLQWTSLAAWALCAIPIVSAFLQSGPYQSRDAYFYIILGGKALGAFYVTSLLLLTRRDRWQALLRPFAFVGKTALSNYLLQTVVTTLGASLLLANTAALPLWTVLVYCPLFFCAQVVLSKWWLARFAYGPMEWLWRMGTYGNVQGMRIRDRR
jgi:uncharacterized protein